MNSRSFPHVRSDSESMKPIGETQNLAAAMPDKVAEMEAVLAKVITDGRSAPGLARKNDVPVDQWKEKAPKREVGKP